MVAGLLRTSFTSITTASGLRALCVLLLGVAACTGCAGRSQAPAHPLPQGGLHRFDHDAFGRTFRIALYADTPARADEAAAAVRERLVDLASKLDPSVPDGELARLVASAGGPWMKVSDELFVMIQQSVRMAKLTGGAADPTAPPLAALWRASFDRGELPAGAAYLDARALAGWQKMQIDSIERRARLLLPGMQLDFGDVAVGYVIDRTFDELGRRGIAAAFIDAGSVKAASGPPPGRTGWGVVVPGPGGRRIELRDAAAAFAGDGDGLKVIGGRSFTGRVDPRTGLGVRVSARSSSPRAARASGGAVTTAVTVQARRAFAAARVADAAATVGPDGAGWLLRSLSQVRVEFRPAAP